MALARQVAAGECSTDAVRWLASGIRLYFERGESLEQCLGLTVPARKIYRDRALLSAAAVLKGDREITPWLLSGELANAIQRFRRRGIFERGQLSSLDEFLAEAHGTGCAVTSSRRRLYDLLTTSEKMSARRVVY